MIRLAFPPISRGAILASLAGGIDLPAGADPAQLFKAVASAGRAGPDDVTVFIEGDDPDDLATSRAGACFVSAKHVSLVPNHMMPLVVEHPLDAFRRALTVFYPAPEARQSTVAGRGIDPAAVVHGHAVLERDVTVDTGAVIGPQVEIGAGTTIGANAVIGPGVRIGRRCIVDASVCIGVSLIGDRVMIHAGARIGVEPTGARCVGRVIIQDGVEIGANAVIERGLLGDTMIGDHAIVEALTLIAADTLVDRIER